MSVLSRGDPCTHFACELDPHANVARCKDRSVMLDTGSVKTLVAAQHGDNVCLHPTHESFISLANLSTCADEDFPRRHFVPEDGMRRLRAQVPGLDVLHGIGLECGTNKCIRNAHVDLSGCNSGGNCFVEVNRPTRPEWTGNVPAKKLDNGNDWCDVAPRVDKKMYDTGSDACSFDEGLDTYIGFGGMKQRQLRMYVDYTQERAFMKTNGFECDDADAS